MISPISSSGYYPAQNISRPLVRAKADAAQPPQAQQKPALRAGTDADLEAFAATADPAFIDQQLRQMNDFLVSLGLEPEDNYVAATKRTSGLSTEELEWVTTRGQTARESRMRHGLDPEGPACYGPVAFQETLTATTATGMQVAVTPAGEAYEVVLSRDGKELSRYTGTKDLCITENDDGSFVFTEFADSSLTGTDGNDIIISKIAKQVAGGDGDDIIFALGSGEYQGNNGDDTLLVGTAYGASIFAGDGNDTIVGNKINGAAIDLGDGNNSVNAGELYKSSVSAGDGANTLNIMRYMKGRIDLGDGDNTVTLKVLEGSSLRLGHGDNSVYIALVDQSLQSANHIAAGNGSNDFRFDMFTHNYTKEASRLNGAANNHTFAFGEGANTLSFKYARLRNYFEKGFAGDISGNLNITA